MDMRNKITQDMLQPKIERSFSDEEGSSDYLFELSDNDSDTSDMRQATLQHSTTSTHHKTYLHVSVISEQPITHTKNRHVNRFTHQNLMPCDL